MGRFEVQQIDHVELFVPDRREAAAWYERVLGLLVVPEYAEWAEDPRGPLMISPDGGSTKLALFAGTPRGDRETAGFHLVAFRTDGPGFRAFLDRLETVEVPSERGGRLTPDQVRDHGKALSIYFRDPWGHRLELTTYDVTG